MPNPSALSSQIWAHISKMSSTRGLLHYTENFTDKIKLFLTHLQGLFANNDPKDIQGTFSQDYIRILTDFAPFLLWLPLL
jgi:hypothetical protein